jgi:hypothetical protein
MVYIKIIYSLMVLELNALCDLQNAEAQNLTGYVRAAVLCHLK